MARHQKVLFPKLAPGCSSFQLPGSDLLLHGRGEEKQIHRVFRTKRKHVQRACDRCRVKKSKCDGNQPCSRCKAYNHACIFRDRKSTQEKVYSRGFVEMLISQHAVHLQALQDLYKRCVTREGFPGTPLQESVHGYPGTHEILDRLGLIKRAEKTIEDPQRVLADLIEYVKTLDPNSECLDCAESTSTETSDTTVSGDVSPEPNTPKDGLEMEAYMPCNEYKWTEMSDSQPSLCYSYDGYKPLHQAQQQHINELAPPVTPENTCNFRNNIGIPESQWNHFSSQYRYVTPATTSPAATCQRNGVPAEEASWPTMTHHPLATSLVTVGSRHDTSAASLYENSSEQAYYPELFGYTGHFYSTSSSA